jgi:hypothetical protein
VAGGSLKRIAIYPAALRRIDGALNFAASWWNRYAISTDHETWLEVA